MGRSSARHWPYAIQESPRGIPEALTIGRRFAGYRSGWPSYWATTCFPVTRCEWPWRGATGEEYTSSRTACRIPGSWRRRVRRRGTAVAITEKPATAGPDGQSRASTSFPARVDEGERSLPTSRRGEIEITDLLRHYAAERRALTVHRLGRRTTWLDTGTPASLMAASDSLRGCSDGTGHSRRIAGVRGECWREA